jgi:hypothetical protein
MNRRMTAAAISFAALAAAGFTVVNSDERIERRVDARIRASVAAIADSLERDGFRPEPLIDYALEGTQKGGNPEVILAGVRKWAKDLRRARQLLGPNATHNDVNAGAKAIRAGVDERQLERLRVQRSGQRYASALHTMAYLISRGVPADTASTVLVNIALHEASDAQMRTLQDEIERDISGGMPPGASTVARALGLLNVIEAGRGGTDGVVPGAALPSTRGTPRPADTMANGSLRGSAVGNQGDAARPPAPRGKDNKRPPP